VDRLLQQWQRVLTLRGRTPVTITQYLRAVQRCDEYLRAHAAIPDGLACPSDATLTPGLAQWFEHWVIRFELGDCSADAVRGVVFAVRAYCEWRASELGWAQNPAQGLTPPPQPRRQPRPLAVRDVRRLFQSAESARDQVMLGCYYHGFRNSEVCQLSTSDVRFDTEQGYAELRVMGKGAVEGVVFLNAEVTQLLAQYLAQRFAAERLPAWWAQLGVEPCDASVTHWCKIGEWTLDRCIPSRLPLIVTDTGVRLTPRWSDARFATLRAKARIPTGAGPHSLRHSCATELLEAGADLRHVQEVMRHASIRSTVRYTAVTRSRRASTMERLPALQEASDG
jgi:site-specific recombinase XerD